MVCPETKACSCPARSGSPFACICSGAKKKRARLFERLLMLQNDLGLLSEEYDPRERRLLGNFPQAFTHVSLIVAAQFLEEK